MSMIRHPSTTPFVAVALACTVGGAAVAPSAHASGRDLWVECRDTGTVGSNHSPQDYADAIASAPGDGAEYTPCLVAIKAAQQEAALRAAGGGKTPTGGTSPRDGDPAKPGGGKPSTAAAAVTPAALGAALHNAAVDPAAYPQAGSAPATRAAPPVDLGGQPVQLGAIPEPSIARTLSLPLPIAGLGMLGLLWAGQLVGRAATSRAARRGPAG